MKCEGEAGKEVAVQDITLENTYIIATELGDIVFQVYPKKAPITVKNFLQYVENGNFEGASFYRVVRMDNQPVNPEKIEVIQGNFISGDLALPPIEHETTNNTGVLHKNGTISMARLEPGTASAAFFICINDQPELDFGGDRNPDMQGFAAFGQVIEGMEIVKQIQSGEADGQSLIKEIKINRIYKRE
ncbi:peptidylprolyl isomerase [Spongiimicrobium sp. 3-5]|uniref:peptidylprolyl isomerase n=1 Tax=Spongiimicrobium sp. 3-5 TaxID=3332596 RepID=UPI00398186C5